MRLDDKVFSIVVACTPLVSIDLVIRNGSGETLLGKRLNRPAQGYWFVPGGRIQKDEPIQQAFVRLAREELDVQITMDNARFLGFYEHFYPDSFSGEKISTHYIVLGFEVRMELDMGQLPSEQHGDYRWWPTAELLGSAEVHVHTKRYLEQEAEFYLMTC